MFNSRSQGLNPDLAETFWEEHTEVERQIIKHIIWRFESYNKTKRSIDAIKMNQCLNEFLSRDASEIKGLNLGETLDVPWVTLENPCKALGLPFQTLCLLSQGYFNRIQKASMTQYYVTDILICSLDASLS